MFDLNWDVAIKSDVVAHIERALLPVKISDGADSVKREGQRVAAVLALLVQRQTGWNLVLTQRPETMPSHPGQISFPGGKKEEGESVKDAALRETWEEIGVEAQDIELFGRLPSFDAVSSYRVTPFVGLLNPTSVMTANPHEVEDIFEVPMSFFMNAANHKARTVFFDGRDHELVDLPYDGPDGVHRNVWGMTAMMIYRFYQRLYTQAVNV